MNHNTVEKFTYPYMDCFDGIDEKILTSQKCCISDVAQRISNLKEYASLWFIGGDNVEIPSTTLKNETGTLVEWSDSFRRHCKYTFPFFFKS